MATRIQATEATSIEAVQAALAAGNAEAIRKVGLQYAMAIHERARAEHTEASWEAADIEGRKRDVALQLGKIIERLNADVAAARARAARANELAIVAVTSQNIIEAAPADEVASRLDAFLATVRGEWR